MAQRAAPERDSRGRGPHAAAARAAPASSQTDRLAWLALRSARKGRRRWIAAEVADLHAMVGRVLPQEMARRLERPLNTVLCKLHALGYRISVDVMEPLGLTAIALARRLDIPYHVLWWEVRAGKVPARKIGYKTFLITWADARAFERRLGRIRRKRERALARITEPTMTKAELVKGPPAEAGGLPGGRQATP